MLRVLTLVAAAVLLGGCGASVARSGSGDATTTASRTLGPASTQPGAPPAGVASPTSTAETAVPPATTRTAGGESAPGGAGDEEGIRVPVSLRLTAAGLRPGTVTVPAFLVMSLSAGSEDGRAHDVVVEDADGRTLTDLRVPAGREAAATVPGVKPGRYPIVVDGAAAGTLVSSPGAGGP